MGQLIFLFLLFGGTFAAILGDSLGIPDVKNNVLEASQIKEEDSYVKIYGNCPRTEWSCNENCRLRVNSTGLCRRASLGDQCFGIDVTYNYVEPEAHIISVLPRYEILSRYPKCWSVLGPLLCAVAYRPCASRKAYQLYEEGEAELELWQLFRRNMCFRAMDKCSFVVKEGLWPGFLNCSDYRTNLDKTQHLFAEDSCKLSYNEKPSSPNRNQCLWPLVQFEGTSEDAKPLIDECHMPCMSTLVSSARGRARFQTKVAIVTAFFAFWFLICFVYLSIFSEVWLTNLCAYMLGHTMFSSFVYYLLWALSYFNFFAESLMCVENGQLRRASGISSIKTIGWCNVQSFVSHTMLLSAFFWLCSFFALQVGRPSIRKDHRITFDGPSCWSLKCVLLCIYLVAACAALPAFWYGKGEADGLMGVCMVGFRTGRDRLWIFAPIFVATSLSLLFAWYFAGHQTSSKKGTGSSVSDERVVGSSTAQESSETRLLISSDSNNQQLKDDAPINNGFASEQTNEVQENQQLISGRNSAQLAVPTVAGTEIDCYSNISNTLLILLFVTFIFAQLMVVTLHSVDPWSPNFEDEFILESQRCSLNATILDGETGWLNTTRHADNLISVTDPLLRKEAVGRRLLNAPGCQLPPMMDTHFLSLFAMYILIPAFPLFTALTMLAFGFCGTGFRNVRRIRKNLNPFVWMTVSESAELQGLDIKDQTQLPTEPSKNTLFSSPPTGGPPCCSEHMMEASILSAYRTGVVEGFWQQVCREYTSRINTLTNCLHEAEDEIRRLNGLPPAGNRPVPVGPVLQNGNGPTTSDGLPLVGLSVINATDVLSGLGLSSNAAPPMGSIPVQTSGIILSAESGLNSAQQGSRAQGENFGPAAPPSYGASEKMKTTNLLTANGQLHDAELDSDSEEEPTTEDSESADDTEGEQFGKADSDSFASDEEDEGEGKMWKGQGTEMKKMEQPGPSNSKKLSEEVKQADEGKNATPTSTDAPSDSEILVEDFVPVEKPRFVMFENQQPPPRQGRRVQLGFAPAPVPSCGRPTQNSSQPAPLGVGRPGLRGRQGGIRCATCPTTDFSVLLNRRCSCQQRQVANADSVGSLLSTFSDEQARGLRHLRSQLTEGELLAYSDRLRDEATRRIANREAASMWPQQMNRQQWARQPVAAREEEEEIPDPTPSASRNENGSSRNDAAQPSANDADNGKDAENAHSGNGGNPPGNGV